MDTYRFVGTKAEVGPLGFDRFGQQVRMTPEVAKNAQLGGCQLVPELEFSKFGFTDEDLKIWSDPFMDPFDVPANKEQAEAKAKFFEKLVRVRERFSVLRQGLVTERSASKTEDVTAPVAEAPKKRPAAGEKE